VREKQAIALPEAVRVLTSRPAKVFGISDRGRLAVGLAADVTVFDPVKVGTSPLRRVYDLPAGADPLVADVSGDRGGDREWNGRPPGLTRCAHAGREIAGRAPAQRRGDDESITGERRHGTARR
jgi:cytosine/adenosine deaminase-related metal-dependent hydrolase